MDLDSEAFHHCLAFSAVAEDLAMAVADDSDTLLPCTDLSKLNLVMPR